MLIDLNLFYYAFILEKCHQLLLCVKWFWNVLYIHCVLLLFIVTALIVLVFLILRARIVLLILCCSLNHRWGWNPSAWPSILGPWRRWWEEWCLWLESRIRARWLLLWRLCFILYLIIFLDTFVNFCFFGRIACGLFIFLLFDRRFRIREIKIRIIEPFNLGIFLIHINLQNNNQIINPKF